MEKRLYCGFALPLEEIALRKVTINLWNESILDPSQKFQNKRDVIEDIVKGKVSKLVLPGLFKKRIMHLVKPIGSDILNWILYHEYNFFGRFNFDLRILLQLRRTLSGAIDYRKTAEEFVHLEMFEVQHRFHFACLFCLEDKIPLLWGELPEEYKTYIFNRYEDESRLLTDTPMMYYWCSVLREDGYNLEHILKKRRLSPSSFYNQALRMSAMKGNKAATEYFFQKLANEERDLLFQTVDDVIRERFRRSLRTRCDFADEQRSDVICYLLSLMTPEQQVRVFTNHPFDVLTCFLDWPLEYFFLDIMDIYWSFLPESSYDLLLSNIHKSIKKSGDYFPNLFQKFFLRSPSNFRKFFVDQECPSGSFLPEFFRTEDTETIKVIFRNIDTGDRVRLVFSEPVFKLLNGFLLRSRWNIVELCIREATLSKEDRKRLQGAFMEYVTRTDNGLRVKWRRHKRRRFFQFLDEMDASLQTKKARKMRHLSKLKNHAANEENNALLRN